MKKYLSFAVTAMAIFGLGTLTSCHDEDFDVSTAVLQERAFEQGFIKEFGKPSENQSWDFYSQKLQSIRQGASLTRATQEVIEPDFSLEQPDDEFFTNIVEEIAYALEEKHDNSDVGQNGYDLVSTGDFKIYAVRYAGDIQVDASYNFELGYIDALNNVEVPLFTTGFREGFAPTMRPDMTKPESSSNPTKYGNPGWAAEVFIPEETSFIFYLRYKANGTVKTFYSNQVPSYSWTSNGQTRTRTYDNYGGTSTLLYSAEHIDEASGKDEQIMMIGFEDGWALQNNYTHNPDYDFNDVVLLIEGKLPIPTAKRFFCEDKKSFDWDYNDVVFDVMSTGIVLRAVGGEQPVFLRVTDRLGRTQIYGELHELMKSLQLAPQLPTQPDNRLKTVTYKRMKDGEEKTFYKSIDVSAYEITGHEDRSVWLDPVQIATWSNLGTQTTHTRLNPEEVKNFSVVVDGTYKGKVELIVLDEYATSYDKNAMLNVQNYPDYGPLDPDTGQPNPIITDGGYQLISLSPAGDVPAMFIAPVSTKWTKELQKITLGYPNFYGKIVNSTNEGGDPIQLYWYEYNVNTDNLYTFLHDEPDDEEEP